MVLIPNWKQPLKTFGDSVSFKGYMGDVAIVVYSGRYTDEDGTEKHFLDPDLMVLGNTALQGIVAYGGIQDPELIRMGLTKAELAPKNYIVPGDPAIEYVQTHLAPQPHTGPYQSFCYRSHWLRGEQWLLITLNSWLALKHWLLRWGYFQLIKG